MVEWLFEKVDPEMSVLRGHLINKENESKWMEMRQSFREIYQYPVEEEHQ